MEAEPCQEGSERGAGQGPSADRLDQWRGVAGLGRLGRGRGRAGRCGLAGHGRTEPPAAPRAPGEAPAWAGGGHGRVDLNWVPGAELRYPEKLRRKAGRALQSFLLPTRFSKCFLLCGKGLYPV